MDALWNGLVIYQMNSIMAHAKHFNFRLEKNEWCSVFRIVAKTNVSGESNSNCAKFNIFIVTMGKVISIIPMQSTTTGTLLLPTLKGKCLRLVVIYPVTKKLKYSISTPIDGQQNVNFHFAPNSKKSYDHLVYWLIILVFFDMQL